MEISEPIDAIDDLSGYDAIQVLVRLRRVPLAFVDLPIEGDRCAADVLVRAIGRQLGSDSLESFVANTRPTASSDANGAGSRISNGAPRDDEDSMPSVTVVVCTRDRVEELASCLDALLRLDYPALLDLLVIDNAPSNNATRRLIENDYPTVRYVCEPRQGLSWARNRGVKESLGEIVAFTDDDVVPEEGWARALAAAFVGSDHVGAVTGLVVPLELETQPQIVFERYGGLGCGFERKRYPDDVTFGNAGSFNPGVMAECGTGANMAFRRSVFTSVGFFDPALGAGTATLGGEDIEMFFRVMKSGFSIIYEPAAIVRHRHYRDNAQLVRQIQGWGTGYSACLACSAAFYPEDRMRLLKAGIRTFGLIVIRWFSSFVRDPGFPRRLFLHELCGGFTGIFRYRQARRDVERFNHEVKWTANDLVRR